MTSSFESSGRTVWTRRSLLATAGGAVGTVLAGCVSGDSDGDGGAGDDGADPTDTDDDPTDTDDDPTETPPTEGDGDPPMSTAGDESPDSCPEYDRVTNVVCYETVDPDEADGYLEPASQSVALGEPAEFTLHNESERVLETNFYDWAVHKYVDGEWYYVDPQEVNDPLMQLSPGETHTWTVTVDNEAVLDGEKISRLSSTDDLRLEGLGGGYYAFRGRGWFEDESYEDATAFAATFELDADAIPLASTDAVEPVEWDGDTLVIESGRGDPDEYPLAAYELERVDGDAERTLLTEQVYRDDPLRDTLANAFEYEADAVRLEEHTTSIPPFASSPDGRFSFQGSTFEATAEELE